MAGSIIQATGMVEFENGLLIGNHLMARNGLQRVSTIPWVRPGVVLTPWFLRGQTEFQSAEVRTIPGAQPGAVRTPRFLRVRLNSNLPGSAWLLGVEPGAGFDSQQLQC